MTEFKWWQTGVVYQIYPRSFYDSNGDGIGDLNGITAKMDYLASLGVDAIWISPIYTSPMADFGYDVADYCDIDPIFGTLDDFDRLLAAAHERGLRVILDWVPNHTSDQHPWFLESRSSRDNPKRDWYIWRDPKPDGSPPNNWVSYFGGSAWEWDEHTQQYYLHLFVKEQPDLNWRNPEVVEAMMDTLRFWLDRGVDGFRMDVIGLIFKDAQLRDEPPKISPPSDYGLAEYETVYSGYQMETHDMLKRIRQLIDSYGDRVAIGEVWSDRRSRWARFYGNRLDELHLPFNFTLMDQPWDASAMRNDVDKLEVALPYGAWPNYVLANHDRPRIGTRYGPQARRVAGMLLLTLRGTPTLYHGDEFGMLNGEVPPDKIKDPPGLIKGPEHSRDGTRTPLQWDDGPYAGFSTVEPWLPIGETYKTINVAAAEADPKSILHMYRALLRLRRETPALNRGHYRPLDTPYNRGIFAFLREWEDERRLIVLNFGGAEETVDLHYIAPQGEIVLSTEMDRQETISLDAIRLRPHEGLLIAYQV